jgi:hypothetical protein
MNDTHHHGKGGAHARHAHGAAGHPARARRWRVLSRSRVRWSRFRRSAFRFVRRKWVRRSLIGAASLAGILAIGMLGLWWRLSSGPIEIDAVTPWLSTAIAENFGGDHKVTIGGTQIERDHGRTSVRILNIEVRDADGVIVASSPKAEIAISGTSLLTGRIRAKSLNLVGAELSVRIETDGKVTVFAGANTRPIAVAQPAGLAPKTPPATQAPSSAPDTLTGVMENAAALLGWIDGIGASGLDGHDLHELGLKDGNLTVDDQRNGKRWTFSEINVSLARPALGGVIFRLESENPQRPWQISAALRPLEGGIRAVGLEARQVSLNDVLLAMRVGGGAIESDLPLSASVRGEFNADGLLLQARGQLVSGAGYIQDRGDPLSRIALDRADIRFAWDGARQTILVPFQIQAGGNQVTLLARGEPSPDRPGVWFVSVDRGDPVIDPIIFVPNSKAGEDGFAFNRASLRATVDMGNQRIELDHGDLGRTDTRPAYNIGIALSGHYDWAAADPRLAFGVAATRMPFSVMRRLWPAFVSPSVRSWVADRMSGGNIERILIAGNAPLSVFVEKGVPIPDEGLSVEVESSGTSLQPVAKLPPIRDADLNIRVTGRTARVYLGRGTIEVAPGRRLNIASGSFEVPDTHPKPSPASAQFRVDGSVAATALLLAMEPLRGSASTLLDPNTTRGNVTAQVGINFGLGRDEVENVTYTVNADLSNFVAERVLINQKIEAQSLRLTASGGDFQVKGDARINGVNANVEFRKAAADPLGDLKLSAVLDEAGRRRLGINFGGAVTGNIPVKLTGRIGTDDARNKIMIDADFSPARIDELLPGWVKPAGKPARLTFTLVKDGKTTRFDDLTLDTHGGIAKGSVELDGNGDLASANFPVFALSGGDQVSLKADRASDGALTVQMRGEVYDGRQFIKSALVSDNGGKKQIDLDLDVRLGAVAGNNGEAVRGLELKLSRRTGHIRAFNMKAKIGRDTPLIGELRMRQRDNHQVLYLETDDAGALFRFTDFYPRMFGGQMWMAMDPPSRDAGPQVGVLNIQNFSVRGETALDRVLSGAPAHAKSSVDFSELRCDFTRTPGRMLIRDGVVRGPTIGATIDGVIDHARDDMRLRGTFVPLYGINNMFGKIPIFGIFLGGGTNEGLLGITYEASGPPSAPRISVNPISAVAPGLLRKMIPGPGNFDPNFVQPTR